MATVRPWLLSGRKLPRPWRFGQDLPYCNTMDTTLLDCCQLCISVTLFINSNLYCNYQGIVKVGAVDADQHKSLGGQYGVRGFPTIKIFGANKNKPDDYQGISNLYTFFSAQFKDSHLVAQWYMLDWSCIKMIVALVGTSAFVSCLPQVGAAARTSWTGPWRFFGLWWRTGWVAGLEAQTTAEGYSITLKTWATTLK